MKKVYLITNKPRYIYITDFDRFMFSKTKIKIKKYFYKSWLQCFSSKKVLDNHKEVCLSVNGTQSVKLEKGIIEFKNCFRQISIPLKIYADVGCILKGAESNEGSCTEKYHNHIPCSFVYKLICIDNEFSKPIVLHRGENAAYKFIEAILEQFDCCKKVMKKYFIKI